MAGAYWASWVDTVGDITTRYPNIGQRIQRSLEEAVGNNDTTNCLQMAERNSWSMERQTRLDQSADMG